MKCLVAVVVGILLYFGNRSSHAIDWKGLADKIKNGVGFANELLGESGEIHREKGCVVKWNIHGTLRGIKWKWVCTCVDLCTGTVEVETKNSREGSMEHCFSKLFKKLAAKGEL